MGWRVSYYQADKTQPLKHHRDKNGYEWVEINGKEVMNNQGTDFWLELKHDDEFQKEIKCLHPHPDCDYYSITKEGFKRIILAYRQRIIDYHRQALENEENPNIVERDWGRCRQTPRELIQDELREWEMEYQDERSEGEKRRYFNINLTDGKELLSGSWKYKYAIFDMIYLLKTFDWEKYAMVVYGG